MIIILRYSMVLPRKLGKFNFEMEMNYPLTCFQFCTRHQAHGRAGILFHHLEMDLQSVWYSSKPWSADVDDAI